LVEYRYKMMAMTSSKPAAKGKKRGGNLAATLKHRGGHNGFFPGKSRARLRHLGVQWRKSGRPVPRSHVMRRSACLLTALLFIGGNAPVWGQDKTRKAPRKLPDGVYEVLGESVKKKDVLPLKQGEVVVIHHHRYLKKDNKQRPRFLVVRSAPAVDLDLAGEPKAVKEGENVVRILLKLRPKAATALEHLTSRRLGEQIAIVVGGEVVTTHKIRDVIKGGDVQITSCAAGAANYLLEQLQARQKKK
jgi:hypothetical protein